MGRKNKLKRFADVATFSNVLEHVPGDSFMVTHQAGEAHDLKGKWSTQYFQNENPVILELACGKGDYTLALAQEDPSGNYIGVDIKGARIWKGARKGLEENIHNAAFLRTRIEFIDKFFGPGEVQEIWITFPDPFEKKPNRRLTSEYFLEKYRAILQPGGFVNLKTDSWLLYEYTLDVIYHDPRCQLYYANPDIYAGPLFSPALRHKTFYELSHLEKGRTSKYVRFMIG